MTRLHVAAVVAAVDADCAELPVRETPAAATPPDRSRTACGRPWAKPGTARWILSAPSKTT